MNNDYKTEVKEEIKKCLQILDGSKSAEGDNSQLLWNNEYTELRKKLLHIEAGAKVLGEPQHHKTG